MSILAALGIAYAASATAFAVLALTIGHRVHWLRLGVGCSLAWIAGTVAMVVA